MMVVMSFCGSTTVAICVSGFALRSGAIVFSLGGGTRVFFAIASGLRWGIGGMALAFAVIGAAFSTGLVFCLLGRGAVPFLAVRLDGAFFTEWERAHFIFKDWQRLRKSRLTEERSAWDSTGCASDRISPARSRAMISRGRRSFIELKPISHGLVPAKPPG
ncbi:MAG: hypothetical protein H7X89_01680 [Rhizobiales bacterium]|nr:hypothetical protein [Hyphomicrobiales bacterium]